MDTLYFTDSNLSGDDIELIFHKEYPYLYNEEEFPVVKFTLKNCQDAQSFDFDWLRDDNDGTTIEIVKGIGETIFKVTNCSDEWLKIKCQTVEKEEIKYRQVDLYYLINELLRNQERDNEMLVKQAQNSTELQTYFEKQLDSISRKLEEANWLSTEKQEFLKGQKFILENALAMLQKSFN